MNRTFDETTALFIREGMRKVCVESVQSTRLVRPVYTAGMSSPIHRGAAGKVLVAFGQTEELLSQIPTENGSYGLVELDRPRWRSLEEFRREIEQIRETRTAISSQEEMPDVWSAASPVFVGDILIGGIALLVPISRIHKSRED